MNSRRFHFISRKELLVISGVLVIMAAVLLISGVSGKKGKYAVIQCGDITKTVSLEEQGKFTVEGCGETVFEVTDGKIRVIEPVCPDKICAETGYISRAGQSIICVPEKIIVTVKNEDYNNDSADVVVG